MVEGIALTSLLAQLQLSDSQFPSGAFAHSYGLEQLVREGWLVDAGGVEAFIRSLLTLQIATCDAVAAAAAATAAHRGDLDELIRLDRALHVTKSAAELRAASCSTGRRLLEEFAVHPEVAVDLVADFLAAVRSGTAVGTHPVALGAIEGALGIDDVSVAAAVLFATAMAVLSAAVRLLPVSHRDVQGTLHRLRPLLASLAQDAAEGSRESAPLTAFQPLQEILSMRHAAAPVRLFAS